MIYHLKRVLCTHSQPRFHKMELKNASLRSAPLFYIWKNDRPTV